MNKLSLISLVIIAAALFFGSCEKENAAPDLTVEVVGKYIGDLTDKQTLTTKSATVDVVKSGDNTVEIHCYSEWMDTTLIMDLYENADSIMVCFSNDEDFYNQYGHHLSENHNMMNRSADYGWMDHKNEEHDNSDKHFGGFDTDMHTFNYLFNVQSENNLKEMHFEGKKQ